ncbi:MAG: iron chelate uptake ABC transporter family permease subunit, partial [Treponema sp.]|nr:iron chelate uptake ABC transporter family permease subunit [Treponema sp.]
MKNMNLALLRKSLFASLILLLLVLFILLSLCIGSELYSPGKIFNALFGAALQNGEREIILKIRLPRMLLALFLG